MLTPLSVPQLLRKRYILKKQFAVFSIVGLVVSLINHPLRPDRENFTGRR